MNKLLVILLLIVKWSLPAHSQKINRYEYWFNQQQPGIVDIAAVQNASVNVNLNTDVLPDGLNSFSIRFRDDNNAWSAALTRFFVKTPVVVGSEQNITMLEYRFNQNELVRQAVSDAKHFSFEQSLNTADLPDGLNSFSIRFRDNSGLWSAMLTRFFVKIPVHPTGSKQIVAYEYRFNQEAMAQQAVTAAVDISIDNVIATADLPNGLNSFSIRFKDSNGLWSSVLTRFFVKLPVSDHVANNELTNCQIWFNDDFQHVQNTKIESGASFNLLEALSVADLPDGLNIVQARFQDSKGLWSSVLSRFFVKNPVQNAPEANLMTAYEYWLEDSEGTVLNFDDSPGRSYVTLDEPVNPMLLDLNVDMRMIPKGNYHLMFRFLDIRGIWSGVLAREIEKTAYPYANFEMDESTFCGPGKVVFSNFSIDTDTWHWDFGDGNESNSFEPEDHYYDQTGEFTVTLTASDSTTGMESKKVKVVKIYPVYEITEIHQICEGDTWQWHGSMYSNAGTYTHLAKTKAGCDSLHILELTVFKVDNQVVADGIILTAQAEDATYQWINCSNSAEISGATQRSFTPSETGSYAVWVEQGECAVLSECFDVTVTFIDDPYLSSGVFIFPNPAADRINLVMEKELINFNIAIWCIKGQMIYSVKNLSGNEYSLPLSGILPGIYLLEIQHQGYSRRLKFVKD
jgi:PKD repeat protein